MLGGITIPFDLGRDRSTQPQSLGHQLGGQLRQTVINWRIEVPHGLEQAQRQDGVRSVRGHIAIVV
jgi:hypothetical protein